MEAHKRNPAPRAAGRALDRFICSAAMNDLEIPQVLAQFQAAHLARTFGIAPSIAAVLAMYAFENGRRA